MFQGKHQVEAAYWHKVSEDKITCLLCPQGCLIEPGQTGQCLVRRNQAGRLIACAYGKITSLALDPIEKKPLHYFRPGSQILSLGSYGCNLQCGFCQNWSISQRKANYVELMPNQLIARAIEEKPNGNIGLAYTYNEPLINFEYVRDCARLAKKAGLVNVLVSNGTINPAPLAELLPLVDAWNIDLKAWQADFYRQVCHGELEWVKRTITELAPHCHLEVTTLLLPGLNDSEAEIKAMATWLASLNKKIVLHLTRHRPDYKMVDPPPISRSRMMQLADLASRHLEYVVLGNI